MEQSGLKEVGNILVSAYLTALSDFMGMMLVPSVPEPGDRPGGRDPHHHLPQFRPRPRLRLLRRDGVPGRRRLRAAPRALPAAARPAVAARHLRRHPPLLTRCRVPRSPSATSPSSGRSPSRIDPSDAGAHNNLGRPLLPEGPGAARRSPRSSRALELDPRMQVAQDNLDTRLPGERPSTTRRIAELQERLRRTPDDRDGALGAGPGLRRAGPARPGGAGRSRRCSPCSVRRARPDPPGPGREGARPHRGARADASRSRPSSIRRSAVARFYQGETLYNRGLNDAALEALEAAIAQQPRLRRGALPAGLRVRRHGAARARARGHQARDRAQPDAGAGAGEPVARAAGAEGREERAGRDGAGGAGVGADGTAAAGSGDPLAHYQLGLAFRQKRYYAEALREYRLALEAGEDRRLVLQAMAEVHLLRRDQGAGAGAVRRAAARVPRARRSSGTSAASACTRRGGARRRRCRTSTPSPPTARYALAWNNLGVLRAAGVRVRRGDGRLPLGAGAAARPALAPGSTWRCC